MASLDDLGPVTVAKFEGHELKCPVCDRRLEVLANVQIKKPVVRRVGTNGMDAVLSVHVDSYTTSININHKCDVKVDRG